MNDSSQIKNLEQWNLSYELCRRCGGTLKKYPLCAICRKAMQHICMQCGSKSEGMLHPCHAYNDAYHDSMSTTKMFSLMLNC